ncbi:MAG: hypothetical protein HYZ14_05680 [Bacteroidetes bacterium]|nr:hypothetical protein [Bacteroidota bacterium]
MKAFGRTILAILFALALIQILVVVNTETSFKLTDLRLASIATASTALYYFIFERKGKK